MKLKKNIFVVSIVAFVALMSVGYVSATSEAIAAVSVITTLAAAVVMALSPALLYGAARKQKDQN
jgi:hypothetical protein